MNKKIIIGLFGISLSSVNYGVTALAYSQIKMLMELSTECERSIEYWIFSDETDKTLNRTKEILTVENIIPKKVVRIRTGLKGLVRMEKDIRQCDLIIDLTYGDSFSDIYGLKHFWLFTLPKLITFKNDKMLILGPQTIGPFYKKQTKRMAKYILQKADYIVARDMLSLSVAQDLADRKDILLSSDLAMQLPYNKEHYSEIISNKINVGLNVSVLLWKKDSNSAKLEIVSSYKEIIYKLLEKLTEMDIRVHLITHVYEESKAEYSLAEKLNREFPKTIVAPYFEGPIDAKNYIANLDVFIGSRMHATIAAFSSGVPVIPISYSRKFEGLYESIGYNHVIKCEELQSDMIVDMIIQKIINRNVLLDDVKYSYEQAKTYNRRYYDLLKKIICSI